MKWLFALSASILLASFAFAAFEDEMASLEKDLAAEYASRKDAPKASGKAIKDMSTSELIKELENEFHSENDVHTDIENKYRARFDAIIKKKNDIDRLLSQDLSTLSKTKDALTNKDIVKMLSDAVENMGQKDQADTGSCVDTRRDCASLKPFCKTHFEKLKIACAKTCSFCVSCDEKIDSKVCEALKKRGQCKQELEPETVARMRSMCPQTCGYCKVASPAKCSQSRFGCCWDKSTTKKDKEGSNCPSCNNQYKYACKTFKPDCMSLFAPGEFMRSSCAKACNLCEGSCYDEPKHMVACPFWSKTLGWCEKKQDMMKFFCPKTCNLC